MAWAAGDGEGMCCCLLAYGSERVRRCCATEAANLPPQQRTTYFRVLPLAYFSKGGCNSLKSVGRCHLRCGKIEAKFSRYKVSMCVYDKAAGPATLIRDSPGLMALIFRLFLS